MIKPKKKLVRKILGHVSVDSGQLMIIDPCYLERHWKESDSYDEVCAVTQNSLSGGTVVDQLGVVFSSGLGDGTYRVTAEYKDMGDWGTRISKVEIKLI